MSLNQVVQTTNSPLDVKFNNAVLVGTLGVTGDTTVQNLDVNGVFKIAGVPLALPLSGTYTPSVCSSTAGVAVTCGLVTYKIIDDICQMSIQVSADFSAAVISNQTFTVTLSAIPGTSVDGSVIYGVACGGASTQFGTGISVPLIGVYPGTPSLTTVSYEFRKSDNAALTTTLLPSTLNMQFSYRNTA